MSFITADSVAASVPSAVALERDLRPNLFGLFKQGAFQHFCATGGGWGDEVRSTTLAWARGYERNWDILEQSALHMGADASLADLLNDASAHSHLTPAGAATGVGKDYESALVELAEKAMGDGSLQLTAAMFAPNWGSPRVTARELRAAIARIKPGGEYAFLGFMENCGHTLRPRHVALASHGPKGYVLHCVNYLTVCGEDMDLAIAYRAAGVNNIDILQQLVAQNVPPEYASALR